MNTKDYFDKCNTNETIKLSLFNKFEQCNPLNDCDYCILNSDDKTLILDFVHIEELRKKMFVKIKIRTNKSNTNFIDQKVFHGGLTHKTYSFFFFFFFQLIPFQIAFAFNF